MFFQEMSLKFAQLVLILINISSGEILHWTHPSSSVRHRLKQEEYRNNEIRDEALQENILIRYQVLGKETNNERHLVGSQNNVPVNSFLDRRMTTKKMHRIKRMAYENQESTEEIIVLDDSQNSSFTSFKAVDQDGIVIPIQKGDNGIPFVTLRAGQMIRLQCDSNLLHQTTNGDNSGQTPEARFSWSSNSASFIATKDSTCCKKIDRTKQDVLDNLVRYRLFNASIFQQIETYLSTPTTIGRYNISKCSRNNGETNPSCSQLSIQQVSYSDSGLYSCTDENAIDSNMANSVQSEWQTCGNDDSKKINRQITSTSLYIFVNDTDRLKANSKYFTYLRNFETHDLDIPCRPTSKAINVTLNLKSGGYFKSASEVEIDPMNVAFDPMTGFKVKNTQNATLADAFICKFTLGNVTAKMIGNIVWIQGPDDVPNKPIFDIVVVNGDAKDDPEPKKIENGPETVWPPVGKTLQIFCNVTVTRTHAMTLTWFKKDRPCTNLTVENGYKRRTYKGDVQYSILTLENFSDLNKGTYKCVATNHMQLESKNTLELKSESCGLQANRIVNNNTHCKAPKGINCQPICIEKGSNVFFSMETFGDTESCNVSWKLPNNETEYLRSPNSFINSLKPNRGVFAFGKRSSANFTMEYTNLDDNGIYSFSVVNNYSEVIGDGGNRYERETKFCLSVLAKPDLKLSRSNGNVHDDSEFYVLRKLYEFKCLIKGNPEPNNVTWVICNGAGNNCRYDTKNISSFSGKSFKRESYITLEAKEESSQIYCMTGHLNNSENIYQSNVISMKILDYSPAKEKIFGICKEQNATANCLSIEIPKNNNIVRYRQESISIVCANAILASNGAFLKSYMPLLRILNSVNSFHQTSYDSTYSQQIILQKAMLQLSDSGTISCHDTNLNITVLDTQPPSTTDTTNNMDGKEIPPNMLGGDVKELILDCSVKGVPEPSIIWFKDEIRIDENKTEEKGTKLRISWRDYDNQDTQFFIDQNITGTYKCIAKNIAGTKTMYKHILATCNIICRLWLDPVGSTLLIGSTVSFGILTILLFCVLYLCRRQKLAKEEISAREIACFLHGNPDEYNSSLPVEEQVCLLPYDADIEFPKQRLTLGQQIGSGAFGKVLKATAVGIVKGEDVSTVAVKMAKPPVDKAHLTSLMGEIKIMQHLGKHLNVVNLLGAVTVNLNKRELFVIIDYCQHGNLQQLLLKNRYLFINQVDPKTGQFDPYGNLRESRRSCRSFSKISRSGKSTIRYATLSMSTEEQGQNDEGEVLTRESNEENNNPNSHPARQHKISLMSTDSEYANATDMTMTTNVPYQQQAPFDEDEDENDGEDKDPNLEPPRTQFCTKDLISWAYQIARGMSHLANRKIIHGDLAARNVLLAGNNLIKICDFGLARNMQQNQIYQKVSSGPLPIKWMAVESLTHRIFSSQSDVWSFGIVLWELFSLARTPYPGVQADESFARKLESGYRMSKPSFSTDDLYKVMTDCWLAEPELRPTFNELAEKMGEELKDGEKDHYLELNKPFEIENEEKQQKYVTLMTKPPLIELPTPTDNNKKRSPNRICNFQKAPKIKLSWTKMKQKSRRSSATLSDILGHIKMKEFGRQDNDQDSQLLSPICQTGPMSESTPMLYIPSQIDVSASDRKLHKTTPNNIPKNIKNNPLLETQKYSASYSQLPSFYNPCYDTLLEGALKTKHNIGNSTSNNKKEHNEKQIGSNSRNNTKKKGKVQKHYKSCDGIAALQIKPSGSSMGWNPMKKDRQQLRFIPLQTFKKNLSSNLGLHSSCETIINNSSASIQKSGTNREENNEKPKNHRENVTSLIVDLSSNHVSSPTKTSPPTSPHREDCVCIEALNRRKIVNSGPPVAPPRPSSTITNSPSSFNSDEATQNKLPAANKKELKLHIPPGETKQEKMANPNVVVTYSKIGILHHVTQPTPPSCGGVQPSTSFDDPLTPPPSYDSAISTPDKHFSLYSISNASAPSIT